jgi:hypothetical protein
MDLSDREVLPAKSVACHIYVDCRGRWRWEAVDALAAIVQFSQGSFETRDECLADALSHGQPLPESAIVF